MINKWRSLEKEIDEIDVSCLPLMGIIGSCLRIESMEVGKHMDIETLDGPMVKIILLTFRPQTEKDNNSPSGSRPLGIELNPGSRRRFPKLLQSYIYGLTVDYWIINSVFNIYLHLLIWFCMPLLLFWTQE